MTRNVTPNGKMNLNTQMTREFNLNDSLHNVVKARRQKKGLTVTNGKVWYYIILNPTKCARFKIIHYSSILYVYMNTCSGRGKFKTFYFFYPFTYQVAQRYIYHVTYHINGVTITYPRICNW